MWSVCSYSRLCWCSFARISESTDCLSGLQDLRAVFTPSITCARSLSQRNGCTCGRQSYLGDGVEVCRPSRNCGEQSLVVGCKEGKQHCLIERRSELRGPCGDEMQQRLKLIKPHEESDPFLPEPNRVAQDRDTHFCCPPKLILLHQMPHDLHQTWPHPS